MEGSEAMQKPLLDDTSMVGDWPEENCDRCGGKGTQILHWGPLAVQKKDQTATMFCQECWHEKAEKYRRTDHVERI